KLSGQFDGGQSYIALSGDGKQLAVLKRLIGPLYILDPASGKEIRSFPTGRTTGAYNRLAIDADRSRIAATTNDDVTSVTGARLVDVWNTATGELLYTLKTPESSIADLAFSPDGKRLATYRNDGTVTVWEAAKGTQLHQFATHDRGYQALAYSPD